MSPFKSVFPRKGTIFLPAINVLHATHARENADIAFSEGADGIFLNEHGINFEHLRRTYETVRAAHPGRWIGIRLPGSSLLEELMEVPSSVSGVWYDRPPEKLAKAAQAVSVLAGSACVMHKGLLFGGFGTDEYKKPGLNEGVAAAHAAPYLHVLALFGPRDGTPPPAETVEKVRRAIGGENPLAVSGITLENFKHYRPFIDAIVIASSITDARTSNLKPEFVRAMAKLCGA